MKRAVTACYHAFLKFFDRTPYFSGLAHIQPSALGDRMKNFWECESGNFAVTFAVAIMPVLASVGVAVDYVRATNVQGFVQDSADVAAFNGSHDGPTGDPAPHLNFMRETIAMRYGPHAWIDKLEVKGEWLSGTDFRVTATGKVPVTFLAAVPGFPDSVGIGATAVVRVAEPKFQYKPPTVTELDPDASDYNQISVYCFDPNYQPPKKGKQGKGGKGGNSSGPVEEDTQGRSQMTVIADNAGTVYHYTMPECAAGEIMSYKLVNVRDSRTNPAAWTSKYSERYEYYTDTTLDGGAEHYDLGNKDILETVLCNKVEECVGKSKGGIIPEGTSRIPQRTTKTCSPGKYMYYGWEDRPPGSGWTDQDYNDIRVVIGCPTVDKVGERVSRLIR